MTDMRPLFQFIDSHKKTNLLFEELVDIRITEIVPYDQLNSWQKHLLFDRLFSFMKLYLLDTFKPKTVIVGSQESFSTPFDEENAKTTELGPLLYKETYSYDFVFDVLLSQIDLSQIYLQNKIMFPFADNIITKVTPDSYADEGEDNITTNSEFYYFVDESIILLNHTIYVATDKKEYLLSILTSLRQKCIDFLQTYGDATTIPHIVFAKWLHEMLPHKIRLKELE